MSCHPGLTYPPPPTSPCPSRPRPPQLPEAAPPPPRDRIEQHNAAASTPPAARGSAQARTPSLLRASACAPSRSRDPLYHSPRRAAAKKNENSSNQMTVPQRVTCWVLKGFPFLHQYVCGLHLSSDARPSQQPCDVNFTSSFPKVELYQVLPDHGNTA